jgi:hypothetical protein
MFIPALKKIIKIFSAFAFFKAPCTPYRGGIIKNNKNFFAFTCFWFSIPFAYKNSQKYVGI